MSLLKTLNLFILVVTELSRSSSTLCQLIWRHPSLSNLLGMVGPPKFDPAMGDRRAGPPPLLYSEPGQESRRWGPEQQAFVLNVPIVTIFPRERTQYSPGTGSSSGPLRLSLGPCASLSPDLIEDPKVAT